MNQDNLNDIPIKQINRLATPISVDENGKTVKKVVINTHKNVINDTKDKKNNLSLILFIICILVIISIVIEVIIFYLLPNIKDNNNPNLKFNDAKILITLNK